MRLLRKHGLAVLVFMLACGLVIPPASVAIPVTKMDPMTDLDPGSVKLPSSTDRANPLIVALDLVNAGKYDEAITISRPF